MKIRRCHISAYANLLKTVMGCGIIIYPFLFAKYGIIQTTILTVLSSMFSAFGLVLYSYVNFKVNKRSTMSTIAYHIWRPMKYIVDLVVIVKCFGVSVSYMIIIKNLLRDISFYLFDKYKFINLFLLIIVVISAPLSFFHKMDKLKFTSILGIFSIIFMLGTTIIRLISANHYESIDIISSNHNFYKHISLFVFGFTCHQNIFTVQNEMSDPSWITMAYIVLCLMCTAIPIFLSFGIMNCLLFGKSVKPNILDTLPHDSLALSLRVFYLIMMVCSVPLQLNPCRSYLLGMINENFNLKPNHWPKRWICAGSLLAVSYLIAISGLDFDQVFSFIGGTMSTTMCFIFPSIYFLLLKESNKSTFKTVISLLTNIWGILIFSSVILKNYLAMDN
ncbi:Vacuolar amino acid transporter 6 [Astathelohania contejeani]|uniref:Vacuolar amino acid transporter 6 n=1 Tax=Astathelohania contejeani TaxID=164912 RepID=A0ABQ7HVD0_9MICR|nr:Vacuolar amino acid transporter 6 [Thelohania contejeani]